VHSDRLREIREKFEINCAYSAHEHMKKDETKRRDHEHRGTQREPGGQRALELAPTVMIFALCLHFH
jgi:hypothetical protein